MRIWPCQNGSLVHHSFCPWCADTMPRMRIPLWLKIVWTVWVMLWIPVYWRGYGAQNFLFFCRLCNIFIFPALLLGSSFIFFLQGRFLLFFFTLVFVVFV